MAGIELKIDDDYINGMASLFETRSQDLQEGVDSYLTILAGSEKRQFRRVIQRTH